MQGYSSLINYSWLIVTSFTIKCHILHVCYVKEAPVFVYGFSVTMWLNTLESFTEN